MTPSKKAPSKKLAPSKNKRQTKFKSKDEKLAPPYEETIIVWDARLLQLRAYKQKFGRDPSTSRKGSKVDLGLGQWLTKQRQKYRKGKLKEKKVQQLRDLGCKHFGGDDGAEDEKVLPCATIDYSLVNALDELHWAPKGTTTFNDKGVEDFRAFVQPVLTMAPPEDASVSTEIHEDFDFVMDDEEELQEAPDVEFVPWEMRFLQLESYCATKGHANPKQSLTASPSDLSLAQWLSNQRQRFRKGALDASKGERLHDLGCTGFDGSIQKIEWETHFLELKVFSTLMGNANPGESDRAQYSGFKLGSWLALQRKMDREGKLPQDKARRLHALGCYGFFEDCFQGEPAQSEISIPVTTQSFEKTIDEDDGGNYTVDL